MKRICFLAQFPPPINGLSKAVDTLYNSKLHDDYELEKIDITNNRLFFKNIMKLKKSKADLFYLTVSQSIGGNIRDLIFLNIISRKKKRCVIHLHGGYYRSLYDNDMKAWQRKANKDFLKKLDGVIVLGDSLKYIYKDLVDDDKLYVVPNCVDYQYLLSDKGVQDKFLELTQKKIYNVLYLSNFIKSKGYQQVLELAVLEKQRVEQGEAQRLHIDMAGAFFDDNEKEEFFNFIKREGIDSYITYHGVVKGEEKQKLLRSSDIFILLTRYPKEGQPISILEAMGNGMMIITTDHAGIPDIVSSNKNGIIATRDMDIKEVYNRLLESLGGIMDIAEYNRNIVINNYTEDKYIQNCQYVFEKVLKE